VTRTAQVQADNKQTKSTYIVNDDDDNNNNNNIINSDNIKIWV